MSRPAPGEREGTAQLPAIPAKRYFTIGEVSELCGVKPHVLRYWEQEFTQLKPIKRRGNRRYYQHHEVLLIRRIRELLYEQGFTINGARNRLDGGNGVAARRRASRNADAGGESLPSPEGGQPGVDAAPVLARTAMPAGLRTELEAIRALLRAGKA